MHDAATALLLTALTIRVFGPDVVRLSKRMLTAVVRVGITGMRPSAPDAPRAPEGELTRGSGE
ncbi:hypothetical protein ACFPH6_38840 [Streptomyces xiangluensis]|uniref:Uncharacterized protein n=1 Tax=Streptomyces xiangluensis TaxID=2665720 RepID=A0ABV8YYQ0_9ACTN